jgi:hypothetical protein
MSVNYGASKSSLVYIRSMSNDFLPTTKYPALTTERLSLIADTLQLQRQLFQDLRPLDKILRIAIETDREGRVSTAKLVELDEAGEATGVYVIPFGAARPNVVPLESKAIHLAPVTVEPITKEEPQAKKKTQAK